jgi:uncharacterized membrane protein YagU involved in acid resistance
MVEMRFIFGALAGLVATVAMTSFMRQAHPHLPASQKYPLPPREIIDRTIGSDTEVAARSRTILMHFGFGALTGGLFAIPSIRRIGGVAYGLAVWTASYLGWIPAMQILSPATRHPVQRNLLMLAAHVVWGLTLAKSLNELDAVGTTFGRQKSDRDSREELRNG